MISIENFSHERHIPSSYVFKREGSFIRHNVPHHCVHHSPDGFEWGYGGSGPADLALNILQDVLLRHGYSDRHVDLYKGKCFQLAWALHHEFKSEFIAAMPEGGGEILFDEVVAWIQNKARELL